MEQICERDIHFSICHVWCIVVFLLRYKRKNIIFLNRYGLVTETFQKVCFRAIQYHSLLFLYNQNWFTKKDVLPGKQTLKSIGGFCWLPRKLLASFSAYRSLEDELTLYKLSQPQQSPARCVLHYLSDTTLSDSSWNEVDMPMQRLALRSSVPVSRKPCTDGELIPCTPGRLTWVWNVNQCSSDCTESAVLKVVEL